MTFKNAATGLSHGGGRFASIFRTAILICISALVSPTLSAEQKPYAPENIPGVTIVTAEQVIDMILASPDLLIIDCRKKTEYQKGHIEGAINILNTHLKQEDLEQVSPDKSRVMLFYCNGIRCTRSSDSIKKVRGWGYTNVVWFRGGWKEWMEKRFPIVMALVCTQIGNPALGDHRDKRRYDRRQGLIDHPAKG
jgi:rhodanese-related sulfurtransferase